MNEEQAVAYDLVVAGAGIVGASLAALLGQAGLRILVVDPHEPLAVWETGTLDIRVYAVTRASEQVLRNAGAWDEVVARGVSPFREMHVWDAAGSGEIHFDSADLAEPLLGYIIEQRVMQAALANRLQALPSVTTRWDTAVAALEAGDRAIEVRLEDGTRTRARLLVGADGARSRVRDLAGIPVEVRPYGQVALVATLATERPHGETAWQRFLPEGPLAFLPLADGRSSIVWSTTPERAEALMALPEAEFATAVAEAFEYRLGAVTRVDERAAFPLRRMHARRYLDERLVLVGDAAHVIHPLAGQGMNLGLLDAAALAEVVLGARAAGRDFGRRANLRPFERWRRGENRLMMELMDAFKRLFGSPLAPVAGLRNLGLGLVDRAPPLKRWLAARAMGLAGDLPRLARPCPRDD